MQLLPDETPVEIAPVCQHHWMLATPVAGVSTGLCRECGASRDFGQVFAPSSYNRLRRK
jgi:hypothetical protein